MDLVKDDKSNLLGIFSIVASSNAVPFLRGSYNDVGSFQTLNVWSEVTTEFDNRFLDFSKARCPIF